MNFLVAFITGRPGWVLLGIVALVVLSSSRIVDFQTLEPRLAFDPSANGLLPEDDEQRDYYDRIRRLFGSDETLLLALVSDDVFTEDVLRRVKRITERVEELEGVHHVLSLSNALNIRARDGDLEIKPFAEEIPTDPAEFERIRREVSENPIYTGNLVSEDDQTAALLIYLLDMTEAEFLAMDLDRKIWEIAEQEAGDARVLLTGAAHVKAEMSRTLLADLLRTMPLASLGLFVIALLSFRSLLRAILPLVTVGISLILTLAVISFFTDSLNVITVVVPPLILVVGFAYAVHVLSEYLDLLREGAEGDVLAVSLRHVALPVALTGATTGAGFLSLATSRLSAIQEFGVFCGIGVGVTVFVSLTFTPAVLRLLPTPRVSEHAVDRMFDSAASLLAVFAVRRRAPIMWASAAIALLAVYGVTRIEVSTDVVRLFSPEAPVRAHFEEVNERLQGSDAIFVVLETDYPNAFKEPANLRHVEALQTWLAEQPEIGGVTSLVDHLKLINRGFNDDDPAHHVIPESKTLISQLFFFGGNDELDAFVDSRYRVANIVARSTAVDSSDVMTLVRRVEERLEGLPGHIEGRVTGNSVLINKTSDEIVIGQTLSLVTAFAIIYLMMTLLFMSPRVGLFALIPNALPVLVYFGVLGLTGTTLNTTTGLVACLVLGIAVDDTIHFLARFNVAAKQQANEAQGVEEALRTVGRPVTYTSAALCLGFLAIATSELRNQAEFGALAAFTLFFAWLVDIVFTPALAARMRIVTLWDVVTLDLGEDPTKSIPLFRGLSARQARIAALMATIQTFAKGHRLFNVDEEGDDAFVVIEGELVATVDTKDGPVVLSSMKRGDVVGDVGLFHRKRTADVEIAADARLLRLTSVDLERLRRRYPRVGAQIYRNLSIILADRVAVSTERMR